MKTQITSILERYRNNKAISNEDIADIILKNTSCFGPMESELILKKLDELSPQMEMIHEEVKEVDEFKEEARSIVKMANENTKLLNDLKDDFKKYKKEINKELKEVTEESSDYRINKLEDAVHFLIQAVRYGEKLF